MLKTVTVEFAGILTIANVIIWVPDIGSDENAIAVKELVFGIADPFTARAIAATRVTGVCIVHFAII